MHGRPLNLEFIYMATLETWMESVGSVVIGILEYLSTVKLSNYEKRKNCVLRRYFHRLCMKTTRSMGPAYVVRGD